MVPSPTAAAGAPGASLAFETLPEVSMWRALWKRGRLAAGATIPPIEATCARLPEEGVADLAARYAAICGFDASDPLPITFPSLWMRPLAMAVMLAPAFPLPMLGVVHVREHIEQRRPIRAGEQLSARVGVKGHRVVRSGGEFDLCCAVLSGGEPIWLGTTTVLSRVIPGAGERAGRAERPPLQGGPSGRWTLPADLGRRYAAINGDRNPIHLWPWSARLFGFRRPIVHGWWTLGRALAQLGAELPSAAVVDASFLAPLPLPSMATFDSGGSPGETGISFQVRNEGSGTVAVIGAVNPFLGPA